jgi:hypothetical protein
MIFSFFTLNIFNKNYQIYISIIWKNIKRLYLVIYSLKYKVENRLHFLYKNFTSWLIEFISILRLRSYLGLKFSKISTLSLLNSIHSLICKSKINNYSLSSSDGFWKKLCVISLRIYKQNWFKWENILLKSIFPYSSIILCI